jgi:hypothetical protein
VPQLSAGRKRPLYHGISFRNPFFFLLDDSFFESSLFVCPWPVAGVAAAPVPSFAAGAAVAVPEVGGEFEDDDSPAFAFGAGEFTYSLEAQWLELAPRTEPSPSFRVGLRREIQ